MSLLFASAAFLYALEAAATPCQRNPYICNGGSSHKQTDSVPDRNREIQEETSCYFAAKKLEAVILNSISNEKALEEAKALLSGLASLCLQAETQESP